MGPTRAPVKSLEVKFRRGLAKGTSDVSGIFLGLFLIT